MTLLYYDPVLMEHNTGDHPECAARLMPVVRHLNFVALDSLCKRPAWQPASMQRVQLVHEKAYIQSVEAFAKQGGGNIDEDTVVSTRSYEVSLLAAGAVCDAVERVLGGEDKTAFCLVRPPGHHAMPDRAMGFCLFNNVAIGAMVATQELGIQRVLIIDFDVHHGNGTQAMFWKNGQIAYYSMHRAPFYPYTGAADETGAEAGLGTTMNVPVTFGTPRAQQLEQFSSSLSEFADRIAPQLILVSAGFDSHRADPVGNLGLETEDFATITRTILKIAEQHTGGKLVSVLEGGYNPNALAECVELHIEELLGRE
ncbi:histone deacetylase [Planctomycetes bacterium K23_9]